MTTPPPNASPQPILPGVPVPLQRTMTDRWFGSHERTQHCERVGAIPQWRRVLFCALSFELWRMARTYDRAAVQALHAGNDDLFDSLLRVSDRIWADVFNIQQPEIP